MAERNFKGVWIPKEIWLAKDLGWSEKVLLVEIDSLDGEQGCFASNEYLADFFKLSKDRISRMVSSLRDKNYITVDFQYKEGTKQIEKRIIRVVRHQYPIGENTNTPSRKQREGLGENTDTPIGENAKDNNTVFNNTSNNTTNRPTDSRQSVIDHDFKLVRDFYNNNINYATPYICELIGHMLNENNPELVLEAMKLAVVAKPERPTQYIESVLRNWRNDRITDLNQLNLQKQAKEAKQNASNQGNNTNGNGYQANLGF